MHSAISFEYSVNSAKSALEYANPQTLYGLINTLYNTDYQLPVEYGEIFKISANAISSRHVLYPESGPNLYNEVFNIGLDTTNEETTEQL